MTANVRHDSGSNEHYTPPLILEAERALMGGIDLDPCSCALANEVVKAQAFFESDALFQPWNGHHITGRVPLRVHCNPPGGLLHPQTLQPVKAVRLPGGLEAVSSNAVYWAKLVHEWQLGNVSEAVYICFNLEVLRTTQSDKIGPGLHPCDFPMCYPKDRLCFWNESTPEAKRGEHGQPSHSSAVVYLPPRDLGTNKWARYMPGVSRRDSAARFVRLFSPIGKCVIPA